MYRIDPHFIYFTWDLKHKNKYLQYKDDKLNTVVVQTSVGVYKNTYGDVLLYPNGTYYWEVKIIKGTYFKIGIIKVSEIGNVKKAFSDLKDGYALYSNGYLRNGGNLDTATGSLDVKKGYGPGDIIRVKYEPKKGHLSFAINEEELEVAFINDNFKKAVYVPAVGALIEGSTYSLTLPLLED